MEAFLSDLACRNTAFKMSAFPSNRSTTSRQQRRLERNGNTPHLPIHKYAVYVTCVLHPGPCNLHTTQRRRGVSCLVFGCLVIASAHYDHHPFAYAHLVQPQSDWFSAVGGMRNYAYHNANRCISVAAILAASCNQNHTFESPDIIRWSPVIMLT